MGLSKGKLWLDPRLGLPLCPVAASSLLPWSFSTAVHLVLKMFPAGCGTFLSPKQVVKLECASESPVQGLLKKQQQH